jgi:DNA repair exonuclease SbcCD ATPase subunit
MGDIIHSKVDLSPECLQQTKDLLYNLAQLRPVVLCAGNHDTNLANKSRMDSLSPMVDAINHPNIYYLRESGLYGFGNILFNNYSVFDSPDKYIKGSDIPSIYRNAYKHIIVLFHGQVDNAITDIGFKIINKTITVSTFDGHDICLLGDIHKTQDLQQYDFATHKPIIHYPGTLVQQNHGEDLKGHGYSYWTLDDNSYTHLDVPNDYGFFTVRVDKGIITSDLNGIPGFTRLRIIHTLGTSDTEIKAVLSQIRSITDVVEVSTELDENSVFPTLTSSGNSVLVGNITDKTYQDELITNYIKTRLKIDDQAFIDEVIKINADTNSLIKKDDFARNIRWIPIKFEFSNMFSYGEDNIVDFTKLKNVVGLFAPNASGKSTIFSALSFCMFDKFDREKSAIDVINNRKTSFHCKFEFDIGGVRYFIEKNGVLDKKGAVKVNVEFWKLVNGIKVELQGEQRKDTNAVIRDYLGTYEDFVLTSLSVQNGKNVGSIIDMGNSDRKDLLSQFMGLSIFDRLHDVANDRLKELTAQLKLFRNDDYTKSLLDYESNLGQFESAYKMEEEDIRIAEERKNKIQTLVLEETKKLLKLDGVVQPITKLEATKAGILVSIDTTKKQIAEHKVKEDNNPLILKKLEDEIKMLEDKDVVNTYKKFQQFLLKKTELTGKMAKLKTQFNSALEIVNRASGYQYDPNCKFCLTNNGNVVVQAATATQKLEEYKNEGTLLKADLDIVTSDVEINKWSEGNYSSYQTLLIQRDKAKNEQSQISSKSVYLTKQLDEMEWVLKDTENAIAVYNKNKEVVEANEATTKIINQVNLELSNVEFDLKSRNARLQGLHTKIALFKEKIKEITVKIEMAKKLESEYKLYDAYTQSVCRDGIPFDVISSAVPAIEAEVNSILNPIVEFHAKFETDGKNIIPYTVYPIKGKWKMTLSSGYEKFVLSVAIRVALVNISNLSKMTGIIIDEGFGVLDAENISHMGSLFSYLKSNFDFVIIVSHLDSIRDIVDNHIEITKDGDGFSHINYI